MTLGDDEVGGHDLCYKSPVCSAVSFDVVEQDRCRVNSDVEIGDAVYDLLGKFPVPFGHITFYILVIRILDFGDACVAEGILWIVGLSSFFFRVQFVLLVMSMFTVLILGWTLDCLRYIIWDSHSYPTYFVEASSLPFFGITSLVMNPKKYNLHL